MSSKLSSMRKKNQYDSIGNLTKKNHNWAQKTEYSYNDVGKMYDIGYLSVMDYGTAVRTVNFSYVSAPNCVELDWLPV